MEKANENQPSAGKSNFSSTSNTPFPDKGADSIALQIPQISLPKGGGAIKGIDEKFEVNAANGTASLSLPLPFSVGRVPCQGIWEFNIPNVVDEWSYHHFFCNFQ